MAFWHSIKIQHIARSIAVLNVLLILILVPSARSLTAWFKEFVTGDTQGYNIVLYISQAAGIAVIVLYFALTKKAYSFPYWLLHAFSLCIPLALVPLQMTHPSELAHIPLYGILTIALVFSFKDRSQRTNVLAKSFALAFCMGLTDEFLQWLHPDRFCDLHDVAINTTAITLGVLISEPLRTLSKGSKKELAA